MRSVEFQKFIDLVTFDQNLVTIEHDIKKSQEVKQSLLQDLERCNEDFLDIKTAQLQARKAVDQKELSVKILDDQEADLKKKLQAVVNQKEYKSLQKETLAINDQRIRHEQELLALWNKLDGIDKSYENQRHIYDQQVAEYNEKINAITTQIQLLEEQLVLLTADRIAQQANIPQEWLDMYVNMKGRVFNPVIPVVNDSCDACFYSITPRDLQMLRNNKLLQCRDCYRLLYFPENK